MRQWIQRRLRERAEEPEERLMNVTDPDSAMLPRSGGGWVQGYNAQAAAVAGGIVVAADLSVNPSDSTMLVPMVTHIGDAVIAATGEQAGVVVADAGYWTSEGIAVIEADEDLPDVLVATGRWLPDEAPDPLAEPDVAAYEAAVAAHDAALAAERSRRITVIARTVNGELKLREAGELLGLSIPAVCNIRRAWNAGAGETAVPAPKRNRPRPPPAPTRAASSRHAMDTRLARPAGRSLYRQRQAVIEPVFGDIKTNRRITRFLRRGHDLVRAEWHWILTGHNLTILHHRTT